MRKESGREEGGRKKEVVMGLRCKTLSGNVVTLTAEDTMHLAGHLWHLYEKEKNPAVAKALNNAHLIVCSALYGTVEKEG